MVESGQTHPAPSEQEGPSHDPPALPDGWLAQWEGKSRKYYYVQRATGHSQWEVPTEPAPSAPTPDPTPQQAIDPFQKPSTPQSHGGKEDGEVVENNDRSVENYQGADRGLLGVKPPPGEPTFANNADVLTTQDMATSILSGKPHRPQHQTQSQSGLGGIAGNLVGGLLSGGKPHGQQHQHQQAQQASMFGGLSTSGSTQHGGLMGLASGLLGHHGSSSQQNSYGYTPNNPVSGTGSQSVHAPAGNHSLPATPGVSSPSGQYGPSSGQYNPLGQQQGQYSSNSNQPGFGQPTYSPSVSGQYGQPNQPFSSALQNQYGRPSQTLPLPSQHGQHGQHTQTFPQQPQSQYGDHNQGFQSPNPGQYSQQNQTFSPSVQGHYGQLGQQNQTFPPPPQGHYGHPGQQPQPYSQPGQAPGQFQSSPGATPFQQGQMSGQYPQASQGSSFQPLQPTSGVIPIQQQQSAFPPQYVGPHGPPSAYRPQYGELYGQPFQQQPGQQGVPRPGQQGPYGQLPQPQQQPGKYTAAGQPPAPGWRA